MQPKDKIATLEAERCQLVAMRENAVRQNNTTLLAAVLNNIRLIDRRLLAGVLLCACVGSPCCTAPSPVLQLRRQRRPPLVRGGGSGSPYSLGHRPCHHMRRGLCTVWLPAREPA